MSILKDVILVLQRLKLATQERHKALEKQLPLLHPALSLREYRRFLARFLGYYVPLEARLLPLPWWPHMGFAYSDRRKAPRLEQDLQALGEAEASVQSLPQCHELPVLETLPQLLGCLYVVEGATLGGQIISRHLHATLGLTANTGAAFFSGYGTRTGSHWKVFCTALSSLTNQHENDEAVITSANDTFATLDRWLFPRASA